MRTRGGRTVRLLREGGEHRCWIRVEDREKLVVGGHAIVVDGGTVRLLSDGEKRGARRTMEAVGLRTREGQRGLGGVV